MPELTITRRFCGPPQSANGGWTSGAVADLVDPTATVEVSLRMPPPLEEPLQVVRSAPEVTLTQRGSVVAEGRPTDAALTATAPVAWERAVEVADSFPGFARHPFPSCFVCGTGREPGDGLRIFPGIIDQGRVAALWQPDPSLADPDDPSRVSLPISWAALDCPGGWAGDFGPRLMVLARMTAHVDVPPEIGRDYLITAEARRHDGRKVFTAATMYDDQGQILGLAEHLWITIEHSDFT